MTDFISKNADWIFDGVGVAAILSLVSFIVWLVKRKSTDNSESPNKTLTQSITGDGNLQVGSTDGKNDVNQTINGNQNKQYSNK